ncbi:MAG: lysylphosphatidylglycerol synthase transmembrane domain-containing protein [Chitinophagaceae bacterium]
MSKRLRTIFQYLFFLALGLLFAWLSVKKLDKEKIGQIRIAFLNAKHWLVIPVFFILFLSHYVRGLRWRLLIQSIGYNPTRTNSFFAVMIGYLVNQGVPRLGEVVKCTVLARYEKIPVEKLIGTIILERIIDALTLIIIFGITLAIQPHLYSEIIDTFFHAKPSPDGAGSGPGTLLITLIAAGIILLALGVWMVWKKKTFSDIAEILRRIGRRIAEGVGAIRHLKKRWSFIFLTILLWSLYFSGGYFGFMAFRETEQYGIREAFTVLSAGSIGMIASPGGIGAYAFMIEKTMQLYGLSYPIAVAFGWILWLATTAVIVIGGLVSFAAIPYYNKKRTLEET